MAHPSLIEVMNKTKDSYNTDAVAQAVATASLVHRYNAVWAPFPLRSVRSALRLGSCSSRAAAGWAIVRSERERVAAALTALGLTCIPSHTNFLLVERATAPLTCAKRARTCAGLTVWIRKQRNRSKREPSQPSSECGAADARPRRRQVSLRAPKGQQRVDQARPPAVLPLP